MQVSRISSQEFTSLYKDEPLIIVDVRTPIETRGEYLADSLFLPLQDITPNAFEQKLSAVSHVDKNEKVYLLCQRGIRADAAVKKLTALEYHHIVVIEGGLNALKANGLKAIKGKNIGLSLQHQIVIVSVLLFIIGAILGFIINWFFSVLSIFTVLNWCVFKVAKVNVIGVLLTKMPWNS